jgi:hypothetical protein
MTSPPSTCSIARTGFPYSDRAPFLGEGVEDSLGELAEFVGKQFGITPAQAEATPENFDSIRRLSIFVRRNPLEPRQ